MATCSYIYMHIYLSIYLSIYKKRLQISKVVTKYFISCKKYVASNIVFFLQWTTCWILIKDIKYQCHKRQQL